MNGDRKQAVRAAFARAAATYDAESDVQRDIALHLADRLPATAARVLEIGCGSGGYTRLLAERYPQAEIQAVDFCPEMLAQARARSTAPHVEWRLADGEELPLEERAYDLITSSSAFQWFADPPAAIRRFACGLTPQGELSFSVFGPGAFAELSQVLAEDHLHPASADFADLETWQGWLSTCFPRVEAGVLRPTRTYPSLAALLRKLQQTGATGGGWRGLLTPARLRSWESRYQAAFGGIVATYEIYFLRGRK